MNPRLSLPSTYVITGDGPVDAEWWLRFQRVLDRGHRLIQLRLKSLSRTELLSVVARAAELGRASECRLLLNCSQKWGTQKLVQESGLAGLHLNATRLMATTARPLPAGLLVGASCHSIEELQKAERIDADFACLSPVRSTPTHPQSPPIGLDTLGRWIARCQLPVYALGGMGVNDIDADIQSVRCVGGQGIAGISAFWK